MSEVMDKAKPKFEKTLEFLQEELAGIRTGRATPALVENLMVEAYGAPMLLKGLASISVPDAKTLVVDPWDKGVLKNIETAIHQSDIGVNPVIDGKIIRLVMPEMTEENRRDMVRRMKEKLEEARIGLRAVREEARGQIGQMEKDKAVGEDEIFRWQEEIDKKTKEYTERVEEIGRKKEEEIMTI